MKMKCKFTTYHNGGKLGLSPETHGLFFYLLVVVC